MRIAFLVYLQRKLKTGKREGEPFPNDSRSHSHSGPSDFVFAASRRHRHLDGSTGGLGSSAYTCDHRVDD